ncbi:MAG: 8-amino-7-oxononanoate synthase [Thioalkalivibrionaceae bacterium]
MNAVARASIAAIDQEDRRRQTRRLDSRQTPHQRINGHERLAFCSNDYLGLAADPRIAQAAMAAAATYGVGAGAAHLINGHHAEHEALETELAQATRREAALLFSTGYMANIGVLQTLSDRHTVVFEDRLNHASLIDAARIQRASTQRYDHGDAHHLAARLTARAPRRRRHERWIIVTDGVFSMDGDIAPLPALVELAQRFDAWLVVDDAHGFGVLGHHGGGTLDSLQLCAAQVPVLIATLGKALGTAGAFIAGDKTLIEWIRQRARTYIYTTAQPPLIAAATRAALAIMRDEPQRRASLQRHIAKFTQAIDRTDLERMPSSTPIQPIKVPGGHDADAVAWAQRLDDLGLLVPAIRSPTVPSGQSRLRVTLSAAHTDADIEHLIDALLATSPQART